MEVEFINTDNLNEKPIVKEVDFGAPPTEHAAEDGLGDGLEEPDEGTTKKKSKPSKAAGSDMHVIDDLVTGEEFVETPDAGDDDEDELPGDKNKSKSGKAPASKDSPVSSPYSVLAKTLHEQGVFADFDEAEFNELAEESSPAEALIAFHQRAIEEGVKQWRESLSPESQEYINALEANVPHSQFMSLQATSLQYAKMTAEQVKENDKLAETLYRSALKLKGFSDAEVDEYVSEADAVKKITDKGVASLAFLQKHVAKEKEAAIEAGRLAQKNRQLANQKMLTDLKDKIESIDQILPNQKLTPKFRKRMFEALTVPVYEDKETGMSYSMLGKKRLDDPHGFDAKVAYLLLTGFFDNKNNAIIGAGKSSAIDELNSILGNGSAIPNKRGVPGSRTQKATADELRESAARTFMKPQ